MEIRILGQALFKEGPDVERTDFNDLQREEGLAVVKRQVELGLEMVRGKGSRVAEEREQATKSSVAQNGLER